MCLCEQIIQKKQLPAIDAELTLENASKKGYRYVSDIPNLYKTINDILTLAGKKGYKVGLPGKDKQAFGLYAKNNK